MGRNLRRRWSRREEIATFIAQYEQGLDSRRMCLSNADFDDARKLSDSFSNVPHGGRQHELLTMVPARGFAAPFGQRVASEPIASQLTWRDNRGSAIERGLSPYRLDRGMVEPIASPLTWR